MTTRAYLLVLALAVPAASSLVARPRFLQPPDGVVEITGIGGDGGIVQLQNGSLMLAQGGGIHETASRSPVFRLSSNGGKTWTSRRPLASEVGAGGMVRLQSGVLAMYGEKDGAVYFTSSRDDGKVWSPGVRIPGYQDFRPMFHSMIQLSSGRLLLVGYWEGLDGEHPDLDRFTATGWGWWRGRFLLMEGHRGVELGVVLTCYSDDEGKTWKQSKGGLFGWFDERGEPNGQGGILDIYEPTAAETNDGRVLLFARSKVGRLVQSYSRDGGITWYSVQPTELASSQSPPLLIRIPKTGHLLCVWNQASGEEIRRGFLRNRLSAAISKDSGLTWESFKTIEASQGVENVARIAPEFPIPRIIRGRPNLGQLPDGFAMFTYPNIDIVGDKIFLRYSRMWPEATDEKFTPSQEGLPLMWPKETVGKATMRGEGVLRIYPLEWFYH